MKRKLLATGFVLIGTLFTACASGAVVVRFAPPPPRYGVMGVAPGPGYVWAEGFWDYRGGSYVWAPGRWMRPPHPRAVWVPGVWVSSGRGYAFRRGHWR
jgi:WXXGXW repeat (2 copies)